MIAGPMLFAFLVTQMSAPMIAGQDIARPLGDMDAVATDRSRLPKSRVGRDFIDPDTLTRSRTRPVVKSVSGKAKMLSVDACDRLWFGRQNDRRRVAEAGRDPCAG